LHPYPNASCGPVLLRRFSEQVIGNGLREVLAICVDPHLTIGRSDVLHLVRTRKAGLQKVLDGLGGLRSLVNLDEDIVVEKGGGEFRVE
jgi:hypothetical protein